MKTCVFDNDTCVECGAPQINARQLCGVFGPEDALTYRGGPGTELKTLLSRFGITATPDCSCNERAANMDRRGCDWCEENIGTVVRWLREEAEARGLPFFDAAGRMLVRRAIKNARQRSDGHPPA